MKITVIVPVYNVQQYLRECLDSIISQTLLDIEIICVNDGSSDKSQEILNEYAWKDSRIIIIDQINQGAYAARNAAIDAAQGDFLCFIDADDCYPDAKVLEELYNAAIDNNVLVCGGSFQENSSGNIIKKWSGNLSQYSFKQNALIQYSDYQFEYGFHRFIYKTDFIKENKIYFPKLSYFEDPVFLVETMSKATEFYCLSRISYSYRTGHKTTSWTYSKIIDLLKGIRKILVIAKEHHYSDLIAIEQARILNDYLDPIFNILNSDCTEELIQILDDINNLIFNNHLKIEYYIFKNKIQHLIYDYSLKQNELEQQMEQNAFNQKSCIQQLTQEVASLHQQLIIAESKTAEPLNKYYKTLTHSIVQKEQIHNLRNTISKRDAALRNLSAQNQAYKFKLKNLEQKVLELQHDNSNLKANLNNTYDMFYNSTTWKLGDLLLKLPKKIKKALMKGN